MEYVLRESDGDKIAIVQSIKHKQEQLPAGSRASLIRGQDGYVRVVPE